MHWIREYCSRACGVTCTVVDMQVADSDDDCGIHSTVLNVNCSVSMQIKCERVIFRHPLHFPAILKWTAILASIIVIRAPLLEVVHLHSFCIHFSDEIVATKTASAAHNSGSKRISYWHCNGCRIRVIAPSHCMNYNDNFDSYECRTRNAYLRSYSQSSLENKQNVRK